MKCDESCSPRPAGNHTLPTSGLNRRELFALMGGGAAMALQTACSADPQRVLSVVRSEPPLHYQGLMEVAQSIRSGDLSPVELTQLMLERIQNLDDGLESYATVLSDQALERARLTETEIRGGTYRGPLHGVPIAVKDLCYTRGVRTMGGMALFADFVPDFDATVVERLEAAGAVMLGKLNLSEGAWDAHHPEFGVPKNPWDRRRWTGVSSSGSGVATAAGLCYGSLGTDTGGSIRYPCAANGLVGLKPTYGRVSRHGVLPLAPTLDHVGPMARRVADAAAIFSVIAGPDPKDLTSLSEPVPNIFDGLKSGVRGLRLGWDREYGTTNVEPQVATAIEAVLAELSEQGADIVDVRVPDLEEPIRAFFTICSAEAAATHRETYPSRAEEYGPGFRPMLEQGTRTTGIAVADAFRIRTELSVQFRQILSAVDAVVCPTVWCAPGIYSDAEILGVPRPINPSPWANDTFTKPTDLSGSPTLTMPCGFTSDGLPLSVQFIGAHLNEAMLLRIGQAYELATAWHSRHPEI